MNKTHKSNEKFCFYCKKLGHFVRNCLKRKNDEKEKANQACEDHEQMFVVTLSANDHTMYDWIDNSSVTQQMTFEQEWFTTYECISPMKVFMGDDTVFGGHWQGEHQSHNASGRQIITRNHHPSSLCSKNEE
jgi:hypothetical protein